MAGPLVVNVDPRELHLPPSRPHGADPGKLQRQLHRYARSIAGMPPILVSLGTDGRYMIVDGVTRASRVAKLLPGQSLQVHVVARLRIPAARFPKLGDHLP